MHDEVDSVIIVPVTSTSLVISSSGPGHGPNQQNVVLVDHLAEFEDGGEHIDISQTPTHDPCPPQLPSVTSQAGVHAEKESTLVLRRNGSIESCSEASSSSSSTHLPNVRGSGDLHQSDAGMEEDDVQPVDLHLIGKSHVISEFSIFNQPNHC